MMGCKGLMFIASITPNMIPPSNHPQGYKRAKKDQKAKKQIESNNINA
jgi:hypothetical protein